MKIECPTRIVASWLPRDIVCIRDKGHKGAHFNQDGKPFLVKNEPKPPLLRKRTVKVRVARTDPPKKVRVVRRKRQS